jgi:hypothetical protein
MEPKMAQPAHALSAPFDEERRGFPRLVINEEAEFLIVEGDMRLPCIIVNISASGAKIACDAIPPSGTDIILFFRNGLSVPAVTTRYEDKALGLKFKAPAS